MESAVQAAKAAHEVKTTAGDSISTGIWSLVGVAITVTGGVIIAIVKQWGPWKKTESDARAADFQRLREEIRGLRDRVDEAEKEARDASKEARNASEQSARYSLKLQTALTACQILLDVVERENASAPEVQLVKNLLAQAAADDMGIGDSMKRLARVKGAGE